MEPIFPHRDILTSLSAGFSTLAAAAVFVVLMLFASVATARLSGEASLTYSSYEGRANGSRRMSSNSLLQNYSLLYSTKGAVYNSRIGYYDVSLGYDWTSLDTTFKSSSQPGENYSVDRGHVLYKGVINLDPKEIPLKFNAYSRDMTRTSTTTSSPVGIESFGSVFGYRDLPTSINSGLHIESGATLIAGAKSGTSSGYNELMRNFPMILIDYKDMINQDLHSMSQVNDRLSRLAFVSLNKKDNWFHYRRTNYNNYLNVEDSYVESQFQLGTVDEYMSRRWVDFSNWLKVSTDLQFSRLKNHNKNAVDDINLNLFVTAERTNWNARALSSFSRYRDENSKLTYTATLPLYASGVVNHDTSWNARTSFRDNHDVDILNATRSHFRNMLVGYRLDTYKRAPFTLSQSLDVESSTTDDSDLLTISAILESTSTPRYSRDVTLAASYSIKDSITSPASASTTNFLEQTLNLRGGYTPTNTLRFDASQRMTFTLGAISTFNAKTRDSSTQISQYYSPRDISNVNADSESFNSVTTLTAAWNPRPRLNTHLTLSEDIYKKSVLLSFLTNVSAGVSFTNEAWNVSNTLRYTRGSRENYDDNAYSISDSATLRYVHSRNLDASATVSYSAGDSTGNSTSHSTSFDQRFNYNFFTRTGIARKLLEINQTLMYSDGSASASGDYKRGLFLGFKYYPINRLTLAGGVGYSYNMTSKDYTLIWNSSVAANFKLLQASVDYVYGTRKSDGARESKFTGNVRKSF